MKKWNIFALMVVTAVVLVVCSAGAPSDGEPMVCYRYNSYVFDASDPAAAAGVYDNVFVARVTAKTGNRLEADEALFPYTVYDVEILRTLKGSLEAGTTQVLYKEGGVNSDGILCVNVGDEQPEIGGYYIFLTSPEEDGGQRAAGAHCQVPLLGLESGSPVNDAMLDANPMVQQYISAVAAQILYEPEAGVVAPQPLLP